MGWVYESSSPPPVAPRGAFSTGFTAPSRRNDYEEYIGLEYGQEQPAPGREAEYEAYKKMQAAAPQAAMGGGGSSFTPPPIDEERRSRSPGISNNFFDISTSDFKTPYGMPKGSGAPAPAEPEMPQVEFGAESPAPGREAEYAAYQAQYGGQAGAQAGGSSSFTPPPIDEERRSRSPGISNNFFDISTSDFKTPYGMPKGSGAPAPAEPEMPQVEFGAESPAPGREAEYAAYQAQYGGQAGAQAGGSSSFTPPPIDEERRSRSPGISNNFYDISTSDFKTPYGMPKGSGAPAGGAPAPDDAEMPQVEFGALSAAPGREAEFSAYQRPPQPPAQGEIGAESSMVGREGQLAASQAQASSPPTPIKGGLPYAPPPIDNERKNRSPGLQHNFYDVSTADFKTPYGMPAGTTPPSAPEPPEGGFGAESPLPGREKQYAALKGGKRGDNKSKRSRSSSGGAADDEDDGVSGAESAAREALAAALRTSLLEAEACARTLADLSFDLAEELQDTAALCADRGPSQSVAVLEDASQTLAEMNEALKTAHEAVKEADANVTATRKRDREVRDAVELAKAATKQRKAAEENVREATKAVDQIPDPELFPKSARSHMETALTECKEQLTTAEAELKAANAEAKKRDKELRDLGDKIRAGL